jgi:light-regulated signal transduction histidine kinase (bacteriophytochrome)
MTQLLQNLIANSIKFHGPKPPRIHLGARRQEQHWLFFVRDHGIGIDPQYGERIFVIFQRLHNRDEYPGTGIGLAICRKIVERHGGQIWVESQPGRGATFYFSLPSADHRLPDTPTGETAAKDSVADRASDLI